jgi:glycosyltransferase involved in cell wall biosynthesis
MRIKIQQFLFGKSYSWSIVGQNLGLALIKLGHDVEFISTDGYDEKYVLPGVGPFIREKPTGQYDCQLSYTAPHNWPEYLKHGKKNKFGIWNYEYKNKKKAKQALLGGMGKFYKATTKVLPSSYFTREVFLGMGIPDEKMVVVPHGINLSDYTGEAKYQLNTNKSKKILLNIAQPHKRKALHLALESFGKAFTKEDDVCLVAKVYKKNHKGNQFDVDFTKILKTFQGKFRNHAEIELVNDYIPDISDLYRACDINFSGTHAECWHLPSLEAIACGLINVVPDYGGQLDFCNENNSLLISGKETRAPKDHQYWSFNPFAVHFEIDTNDAANKLRLAVNEYDSLITSFGSSMKDTTEKFTWENAALQILDLCE